MSWSRSRCSGRSRSRCRWLAFALIALVLSGVGIYGVMVYYVQQHVKEISIRMALGSSASGVARMVIGQGMTVVIAGVAIGVAAWALGLTRLMSEPALWHRRSRSRSRSPALRC